MFAKPPNIKYKTCMSLISTAQPITPESIKEDVKKIERISVVPGLLNVICRTTGMRFAAVARVTETKWVTCSVQDEISFGLTPGDELVLETTICNEIRQHFQPVIIDHVAEDPLFKDHHTPLQYGFQSYISIPIIRKDGTFFGTLCAIDPSPNKLDTPEVRDMFTLFADLISFHLNAIEENTDKLLEKNKELEKMNKELQSFSYIASHDLQEPLRKIQTFADRILEKEHETLSGEGREYFRRMQNAAKRMQALIDDLLTYSRTSTDEKLFKHTDLNEIIQQVKEDLKEEIASKHAVIEAKNLPALSIIPFQIRQMMQNLISNSLKFSFPDKAPHISITGEETDGTHSGEKLYRILLKDNGIGFEDMYREKIFEVFQRLHGKMEYSGTGIGLAIVRKIVENHNGKISAESTFGEGAVFEILLPAE
jgi:signal transduction histidine kinase